MHWILSRRGVRVHVNKCEFVRVRLHVIVHVHVRVRVRVRVCVCVRVCMSKRKIVCASTYAEVTSEKLERTARPIQRPLSASS